MKARLKQVKIDAYGHFFIGVTKLNKALFEDVQKVLRPLEGLPVWEARTVLRAALEVIERHSFLNLDMFTEKEEVKENGK